MKEKEEARLLLLKEQEKELRKKGFNAICGIDEAGRGPLAGPVVVASVIMPADSMIEGVNDSKKVSEKKREKLYDLILEEAISYGVGIVGQDEIDEINILNATKKGLTMSLQELTVKPDLIIVDALNHIDTLGIPYESIIKGDAKCYSIAAASIIAKLLGTELCVNGIKFIQNMDLKNIKDMELLLILQLLKNMDFVLYIEEVLQHILYKLGKLGTVLFYIVKKELVLF